MFYIFGLVLHVIFHPDVSFAMDTKCEIKSSCYMSGCHLPEPMTVDPGSNITLNCTTITGGPVRNMTWRGLKNSKGFSTLVLKESYSTKSGGNYSCRCTTINFASALKIVLPSTNSPDYIYQHKSKDLNCAFKGWPFPHTVSWFKDNKLITNGTEGIYHFRRRRKEHVLDSILRIPPGREDLVGSYVCNATNGIPGWSSSESRKMQIRYECPIPEGSTISDTEISVFAFSNVNLTCFIDWNEPFAKLLACPADQSWYLSREDLPTTGEKYNQYFENTTSKCKKKLVLSIFNVTENDEGTYGCHFLCGGENTTKDEINLKVSVQRPTEFSESTTSGEYRITTSMSQSNSLLAHSERPRKWFQPVLISSAGTVCIVLAMLFVWFVFKKRRAASSTKTKYCSMQKEFIHQLFISHSSKDFDWVTENLISVIEKHSITYSIHNRDFELGKPIVENMADSVYASRRVLIVLSKNYLASNFCREELHMAAQRELDEEDSSLILVMINKLKKKQLPTALKKKPMLDFDKHKKKQDWEETMLREILDGELITGV